VATGAQNWLLRSCRQGERSLLVAAWAGQFVGHAIEGRKPSFFEDLKFLLVGPAWLLAAAYRRFGIGY
jgi:uncharacterized membrane protein YGL010W